MYLLLAFALLSAASWAQQKKTLTTDDYKKWERLSMMGVSPDGQWVAYRVQPDEGNDTLYLLNTKNDSIYKEAFGSGVQFSADSKWAAWRIGVSRKTEEEMQEKKMPVHYKLAVMNLATLNKIVFKEVSSFAFPKEGTLLAMSMYPPKDFKGKGNDLVILDPVTGVTRNIGNVSGFSFNKKGDFLACIIQPANAAGNSVELYDLKKSIIHILASDTLPFSSLTWTREGNSLGFLHQVKDTGFIEENQEIVLYKNLYKGLMKSVYRPDTVSGFPKNMRIQDSRLQWSLDETAVFFGIQSWNPKEHKSGGKASKGADKKNEKQPGVDVWHWNDPQIQPQQKLQYNMLKNQSHLCMWIPGENRFLQIADSLHKDATLSGDQKNAWIYTTKPYEPQFRLTYGDYFRVDLKSGKREPMLKKYTGFVAASPAGKYALFFREKHWWTYDLATGKETNLTGNLEVPFWDIKDDHPAEVRPSFGSGGWIKDDKAVLLYDEFDVWSVKPDGSGAVKLTSGRTDQLVYRVTRLEYENNYLDTNELIYFTLNGDKTKKTGYARMKWGAQPEILMLEDQMVTGLTKALKADQFVFTTMTYEKSPSLFRTDLAFKTRDTIATSNKQQKDFAWGRAELVNFRNKSGQELQGVLHYPANYEAGKQYPMVVYIYEIRSNSLYSYINPSDKSSYNVTNYVQQGFFVFQPDIVYRLDDPGLSAVECVVPAVEKVLETGMIDRKKIGLMGHSWGAYQTAFIITQTDLFSAAVAGAPLTDMISMYTEVYWNSGTPNQQIFETSQGRFTRPYWEILENYMANSPMFQAAKIKTPLLMTFGDQDGAVDWHQGIELYTTMRRMQKPLVMLVYAGENHGLAKKENQLDYTRRINEWFNHYLLQQEPKEWITKGVSYAEKMKKEEPAKEVK